MNRGNSFLSIENFTGHKSGIKRQVVYVVTHKWKIKELISKDIYSRTVHCQRHVKIEGRKKAG